MTKNYKSWLAFMVFMVAYGYAVFKGQPEPVVYTTGLFFVFISFGMMLRSEQLYELLKTIAERLKKDA